MAKYKYQNISEEELAIINVGVVAPGDTIESDTPIENANLELVSGPKDDRQVGVDVVTQPKKR